VSHQEVVTIFVSYLGQSKKQAVPVIYQDSDTFSGSPDKL